MGLAETLAEVQMPIYGVADLDHPFDLTLRSHFLTIGRDKSVILNFISSRYPSCPFDASIKSTLRIKTANTGVGTEDATLEETLLGCGQPLRNPFRWEGTLTLEGIPFSGAIRYYATPLWATGFCFESEKSFLSGYAYGPSCDEMIELLVGLQVLNGRDDLIRQYEAKVPSIGETHASDQ
jgi:hypothetical protein